MSERRRLPVIQSPPPPSKGGGSKGDAEIAIDDDAIEKRPPWHWVGFGAVAIFATWLPGAAVAQKLGERLVASRFGDLDQAELAQRLASLPKNELMAVVVPLALLHLLALAIGATAGGYLVGRFGSGTTVREPMLAGGVVALMAITLTIGSGGVTSALVTGAAILVVSVGCAALGGKRGLKRKDKSAPVADG